MAKKFTGVSTDKLREYFQGRNMPQGGLRYQVLQKKSSADFDAGWSDVIGSAAIRYNVTIPASGWVEDSTGVWKNQIALSGAGISSILSIVLDEDAYAILDGVNSKHIYVENNHPYFFVVSIGGKPTSDFDAVIVRNDSILFNGLASLAVSGSWTNPQFVGHAPDTTGLTFTATYNDGTTQTVTAVSVSPATWSATGTQTATFTYSELGVEKTCTKDATVQAVVPASLSIVGAIPTQYVSTPVNVAGLTYTCTYTDGTPATVTGVTHSPATWGATAGNYDITFSYTEGATTVTKVVNVPVIVGVYLTGLNYTGSWTGVQRVNHPVDKTGFTFAATYSDGTSAVVTSVTANPATWTTTGSHTCEFSYTEGGITKTVTSPAVHVYSESPTLESLTCDSTNKVTQYVGKAVNTTGLIFTAHYDDTTTATVTPQSVSPSTWTTQGLHPATFTYTEGTVPKTCEVTFTVEVGHLTGLSMVGSLPTQYKESPVTMGSVTFTATYSDGTTVTGLTYPTVERNRETWGTELTQTIKFTYNQGSYSADTTVSVSPSNRVLSSITLTGNPPSPQNVGTVDASGVTVTAYYETGNPKDVTSSTTHSPTTWDTTGSKTITYSYTENGVTKTATKSVTVIDAVLEIKCVGTPVSPQYLGNSVNISGLTIQARLQSSPSTWTTVSGYTHSPETWTGSAGTKYITFSYGGQECQSSGISVQAAIVYNRVGGRIFYLTGSLSDYTFYDSSKNVLSTKTVAGLANAYYYSTSSTPSSDHVYVYDTNGSSGLAEYGGYGTSTGASGSGIGAGKTNTNKALANSASFTPNTPSNTTIWKWLRDTVRAGNRGGCSDWFIGTEAENDILLASGFITLTWGTMWASREYTANSAYWYGNMGSGYQWQWTTKPSTSEVFAIRSF